MNRSIILALISAVIFFSGCGPKIIPVAIQGAVINEKRGSISIEKDGIVVTAEATLLLNTPYNLESYFTPFRVVVRNETGSDTVIAYDAFLLLDEKGNQYRAYSPERMVEIVKSDPEYVMKPPTVAIQLPTLSNYTSPLYPPPNPYGYGRYPYGVPYYDSGLGHWTYPSYADPSYSYKDYRRDQLGETLMQDIFLTSLPVGVIVDGAQISGNVYFRVDMREVKSAKVRVTVNGTLFELPFLVK